MTKNHSKQTKKTKAAAAKKNAKAKALAIKKKASKSKATKSLGGFADFIRNQGVVGIAIGFIVGTQARDLVNVFSSSFVNPLVGLLLPGAGELQGRVFVLDALGKRTIFGWGDFVYAFINFIVIAAIIYIIFKIFRLDRLDKKS